MSVNDIELYRSDDGSVQLEVNVRGDTVWLSRDQMAELFGRNKSTIYRHVRNVFDEGELDYEAVVAKIATTAADGNKRIAAATFVGFLEGNAAAFGGDGGPVVTNNDLAAITLLIAVSDPGEKDLMIDLVERMLTVRENDDGRNR